MRNLNAASQRQQNRRVLRRITPCLCLCTVSSEGSFLLRLSLTGSLFGCWETHAPLCYQAENCPSFLRLAFPGNSLKILGLGWVEFHSMPPLVSRRWRLPWSDLLGRIRACSQVAVGMVAVLFRDQGWDVSSPFGSTLAPCGQGTYFSFWIGFKVNQPDFGWWHHKAMKKCRKVFRLMVSFFKKIAYIFQSRVLQLLRQGHTKHWWKSQDIFEKQVEGLMPCGPIINQEQYIK